MRNLLASLLKALTIATAVACGPSSNGELASESSEDGGIDELAAAGRCRTPLLLASHELPRTLSELDVQQVMQFAELGAEAEPVASGVVLGELLSSVDGLDRAYLICELATSQNHNCRLALAHALARGTLTVGVPQALTHLARDEDPRVRGAALDSAAKLRTSRA